MEKILLRNKIEKVLISLFFNLHFIKNVSNDFHSGSVFSCGIKHLVITFTMSQMAYLYVLENMKKTKTISNFIILV